jgi:hypothetical protein
VLALQAQTYAAMARWDDSEHFLDEMMTLLSKRRSELPNNTRDPALHALSLLLEGYDAEVARTYDKAIEHYKHAYQVAEANKLAPALLWALRQKIGKH